jgi:hypothetical protein
MCFSGMAPIPTQRFQLLGYECIAANITASTLCLHMYVTLDTSYILIHVQHLRAGLSGRVRHVHI